MVSRCGEERDYESARTEIYNFVGNRRFSCLPRHELVKIFEDTSRSLAYFCIDKNVKEGAVEEKLANFVIKPTWERVKE